jgi:hypothetical protein
MKQTRNIKDNYKLSEDYKGVQCFCHDYAICRQTVKRNLKLKDIINVQVTHTVEMLLKTFIFSNRSEYCYFLTTRNGVYSFDTNDLSVDLSV